MKLLIGYGSMGKFFHLKEFSESLEKLGDLENAKTAYSMAKILRPKEYHRADRAIENVEEKLLDLVTLKDQKQESFLSHHVYDDLYACLQNIFH